RRVQGEPESPGRKAALPGSTPNQGVSPRDVRRVEFTSDTESGGGQRRRRTSPPGIHLPFVTSLWTPAPRGRAAASALLSLFAPVGSEERPGAQRERPNPTVQDRPNSWPRSGHTRKLSPSVPDAGFELADLGPDTTSLFVCGAEDRTRAARMPGKRATA
ncbi:hypothetical protein H1C71_028509, partial [Ictidomys tridecemlineatus]